MNFRTTHAVVWLAIGFTCAGCAPERTRVVDEPRASAPENRDYRSMVERVRTRQNPIQLQHTLEESIRKFQRDLSRLPTNLLELVHRRYLPELKAAPEGYAYSYDPVHGNVAIIPIGVKPALSSIAAPTNPTIFQMSDPQLPPPP